MTPEKVMNRLWYRNGQGVVKMEQGNQEHFEDSSDVALLSGPLIVEISMTEAS